MTLVKCCDVSDRKIGVQYLVRNMTNSVQTQIKALMTMSSILVNGINTYCRYITYNRYCIKPCLQYHTDVKKENHSNMPLGDTHPLVLRLIPDSALRGNSWDERNV